MNGPAARCADAACGHPRAHHLSAPCSRPCAGEHRALGAVRRSSCGCLGFYDDQPGEGEPE